MLISRIVQASFCYRHAIPIRDLERKLGNQILKQASSSEVLLRLCCLLLNNAIRNLQAEISRHSIGTAGTENYNGKTCLLILAVQFMALKPKTKTGDLQAKLASAARPLIDILSRIEPSTKNSIRRRIGTPICDLETQNEKGVTCKQSWPAQRAR